MKELITILLLLSVVRIHSQEDTSNLTIDIKNLNLIEVIDSLERKTDYQFLFNNDDIDKNIIINKTYYKKSLNYIVTDILKNTKINFYVDNYNLKIILTRGILIREPLYKVNDNNNQTPPAIISKNENYDSIIGKETNIFKDKYTLKGQVFNYKNNKVIRGATIIERNKNIYATTNSLGEFSIQLPYGINKLEVIMTGFSNETKTIILLNNGKINFYLFEKLEELDEVIVLSNKNNKIKQKTTGVSYLKAKDIKTIPQVLGERDLIRAALTLPGINSAGEGADGVNVRGGKVDQNLFLLDGGILYNPTHFLGLFSAINPFTTNDLNIFKGNIPIEHGGRLSSVFEISTNNASTTKFKGEASVGPVTANLMIEHPIIKDKSGLIIGARSTYSKWILKVLDDKKLKNSNVNFNDFIIKYNHKLNNKNQISTTAYYSNDKFQIASDSINNYSNKMISFNWINTINDKTKSKLTISNSNYNFNIDYSADNNRSFDLNYNLNETNLKYKFNYKYSKKHNITYGIQSKLYNIDPGNITPKNDDSTVTKIDIPKEKALENSIYLSDNISFSKKLSYNVGIRFTNYLGLGNHEQRIYESNKPKNSSNLIATKNFKNNQIHQSYNGVSYRIGSNYSFKNDLILKGSINKSFQFIHRLSNNTTASPLDTWRLSDKNIKPQEGIQFSLGLLKFFENKTYEINLESYYKSYKNLIDYKIGANLLLNKTIETEVLQGPGKSYGVEFLLKKSTGQFNGWFSYSYSKSLIKLDSDFEEETVNNGEYFPTNYDKPHSLDIVLNYKITNRYSISSNFSYQSGRPVTYPTGKYTYNNTEYLTYSNRNQFRIPDYFRLDIGVNIEGSYKIKKFAHSFWNFSIYNVLGRNNPYSIYFETQNGNVSGYKSSVFSSPIPTITYNFKF
ncbi:TonB-dependent receptor [Tenacibaculum geojense]|uniref:TonB-dependent receptor domain-containing protein n=1 Tax=Tenacibaculum geojense TaxID=915352 RepID=A0ABW3JWX3_9FLAO